ncbi:hypothetical protein AMATHDRAFT_135423 [Amanita thiersii Skay4041]|uniref:Mitochondrial import inner membrane translocase subunit TIM54 n=1 Tax=Amanita thiersii Skay4041 TaxID=703135 RepID=A0A2A9P0W1_9AGAR|nr:hypothetical protein AMATHDRAFT_135423 [Amanita thiersii Skay4041]
MSAHGAQDPPVEPSDPPKRFAGIRAALRFTGLPTSWLDKRPKLPSRNWLIFLTTVSSVTGYYVYDRRQCKQIRQTYIDRVKHFSEEATDPLALPRKVTVYGAKWPGDEDYNQCIKHFRKYVKPILVAAAVDYEMIVGKRHGDIARRVAEDTRLRRRIDLGIDVDSDYTKVLPTYKPVSEQRQAELDGGIVIVGRPTFKEFMAGLKKGWTDGLDEIDQDEVLARDLESDGYFDESDDGVDNGESGSSEKVASQPLIKQPPAYTPLYTSPSSFLTPSTPPMRGKIPQALNDPPAEIPQLPPLLLVNFVDHLGFKQIPLMLWGFFNQRHQVRSGAEAAYRLIMKTTRRIDKGQNDLDFGTMDEAYYKKSSLVDDINAARKKYYEALPAKLDVARALSRGAREPTKEERENPPPTEVELRAGRMDKERRWRNDLVGWSIINPSSNVAWDERFTNALQIFVDPTESTYSSD